MTAVVGTPLRRKEDPKLLTGEARFVDDLVVPGALHAAIVRSPYAHATISSVDLSAALAQPGVVAAFSGADLRSEWAGPMPCAWPVTEDMRNPEHLPIAVHTACYVGDAVAVVVAETDVAARDAAEAVDVDYDVLPAVVDLEDALSDRVLVHEALGTNRSYTWELIPDPDAVEEAFAHAAHTVTERFVQQRLIPSAMETRGVVAVPAVFGGEFVLYTATQIPHILRVLAALTLGISETKLRVVAPAVGGGFGSKLDVYAEELLCLALARRLGRPVRWSEERMENTQATIHGRGMIQHVELAADADGKVTAVRVRLLADMGAYLQLVTPGIPAARAPSCTAGSTTSPPTPSCAPVGVHDQDPDRRLPGGGPARGDLRHRAGHGRPGPPDRRRPGRDPAAQLRAARPVPLQLLRGPGLRQRQLRARPGPGPGDWSGYTRPAGRAGPAPATGSTKHLGIGLSSYVEMCGLAPSRVLSALRYVAGGWEAATVRLLPTGKVQVVTGTTPHGQGHETSWSMIAADQLGVSPDDVEVLHSDTSVVAVRDGHLRVPVAGGGRHGGVAGHREGDRQGQADRGPPVGGGGRGPGLRQRHLHGDGARPTGPWRWARSPSRRSPPTTCPTGWSPTWRRPATSTRPTSPSPSGPTSAWWTWTPRRARSTCSSTWRSTTAAPRSTR